MMPPLHGERLRGYMASMREVTAQAILNSKCASYWYRTFFKSMSLAGGYLRIGHAQLRLVPIPPYEPESGRLIVSLANTLLKAPESDELWKRLNDAVYRLYGLTADEIAVVEGTR